MYRRSLPTTQSSRTPPSLRNVSTKRSPAQEVQAFHAGLVERANKATRKPSNTSRLTSYQKEVEETLQYHAKLDRLRESIEAKAVRDKPNYLEDDTIYSGLQDQLWNLKSQVSQNLAVWADAGSMFAHFIRNDYNLLYFGVNMSDPNTSFADHAAPIQHHCHQKLRQQFPSLHFRGGRFRSGYILEVSWGLVEIRKAYQPIFLMSHIVPLDD